MALQPAHHSIVPWAAAASQTAHWPHNLTQLERRLTVFALRSASRETWWAQTLSQRSQGTGSCSLVVVALRVRHLRGNKKTKVA
jgi:hypothetical protein